MREVISRLAAVLTHAAITASSGPLRSVMSAVLITVLAAAASGLSAVPCLAQATASVTSAGVPAGPARKAAISTDFYKQPMSFEPNVGQFQGKDAVSGGGEHPLFFSRGAGLALELGAAQARLSLADRKSDPSASGHSDGDASITLGYLDADPSVAVSGQKLLLGKHNYIPTGDPKTWHQNVPTYGAIEYRHLYPGVDLSFYGNPDRLEYDFTVAPASDIARIRLSIAGTQSISTDAAGDLLLVSNGRTIRFLKPVAYQTSQNGERRPVDAAYKLDRRGGKSQPVIGFALGEYDHSQTLVIDPIVDYAFYVPGAVNGDLYVGASTTDASGNTYLAGTFPSQGGFFIAKYNSNGAEVFFTPLGNVTRPYFGGSVNGIVVDSTGRVYVAGSQSGGGGGLPVVNGSQTSGSGGSAFLMVLSADGSAPTYSTYFGGATQGLSVAVDPSGNAYVSGLQINLGGTSLPITPGAPIQTFPGFGPSVVAGWVAKFDPSASGTASLLYSTYIGGAGVPVNTDALAVDAAGNAYVTGTTTADYYGSASPLPVTPGAYAYNGRSALNDDVFVTKINPTGTAFLYSALLGPGQGRAIAVDSSGDVYVTGLVYEDDYPTTSGAYQATYPSGFVTELNPAGSALVYSTFLGGPNDKLGSGASYIAPTHMALPPGCASACPVYVAGVTNGSDLPLVKQVQSYVPGSTWSGFYMEVAGNGSQLLQSSYFASGSGFDTTQQVPGIGVDNRGYIYLAGDVLPSYLPTTQTTVGQTGEGFLARVKTESGPQLSVSPSSIVFPTKQIVDVSTAQQGLTQPTVTLEDLGDEAVTLSSITPSSTLFSQTNNCNGTVPAGGNCTVTLSYTPSAAGTQTGSISFTSSNANSTLLNLSGTGASDRFLVASCGSVTPCAALSYQDTVIGAAAPAQVVTLTNLGNTAVALKTITSSLPDYTLITNCPQTGTGLANGQSCTISVLFAPTQIGLRSGTITITSPGLVTTNTITLAVTGTGVLSPDPSSLVLLGSMMNFGTVTLGATSAAQTVTVFNNGTAPATVFTPTVATAGDAAGVNDYTISSNTCAQVLPEASCTLMVNFLPTAAGTRTGTLTIPTSASSTPLTSSLTGIGVAQKQSLEFNPDAITFPDQVIDASSAIATAYVYNVGPSPVAIDRVVISGSYRLTYDNCSQTTLASAPAGVPGNANYASCYVQIVFSPTATGPQTGTVTVIDSEGNQTPLSLAGNAVAQNGALYISPGGFNFGTEPVGTTSSRQQFTVTNIGNSPVTVTGATMSNGDYSYTANPAFPWNFTAGQNCCFYLYTYFTPTSAANPDNGTMTLTSTAGSLTVSLTGAGEAASKAILMSPPSAAGLDFGNIQVGKVTASEAYYVYAYNPGTDPVTFSASPQISGTNASDFTVSNNYCGGANATLGAGASCFVWFNFAPSAAGTRSATLTFSDNAPTGTGLQTLSLTGTGTAAAPGYILSPNTVAFGPQPVGTASSPKNLTFINNSGSPVTIASVSFSPAGSFTRAQDYYGDCNEGAVRANGGSCVVEIAFAPTAVGQVNGTATLTDSKGNTYVAQLYGYGTPTVDSIYFSPNSLNFAPQPQLSTSGTQTSYIYNYSSQPATIGQVTGTNVKVGTSAGAFTLGSDGCSGRTLTVNASCILSQISLSPSASTALGAQAGAIAIPVTYGDGTKASYTLGLNGTVVAPYNSAELSPTVLTFADIPVNTTSGTNTITLTNRSNEAFTVGPLSSNNTFSAGPFALTGGNCSGSLAAGVSCTEQIVFKPATAGTGISGSLNFPITFTNGQTQTLTATYSGNALPATSSLVITPTAGDFGPMVAGQTGRVITFKVTNNGNQPVAFGAAALASTQPGTNFTRNNFDYNSCSNTSLAAGLSCSFDIYFTPSTTALGTSTSPVTINGTLTIADGAATGGPHVIPLVGTALPATQTIAVSQSNVTFGNQPVGTASAPQAVYVTDQSANAVGGFKYTLGGADPSDFKLQTNNCGTGIYGQSGCSLLVSFAPAATSLGARTASITISFTGSGSPVVVTLNGSGYLASTAIALTAQPSASVSYGQPLSVLVSVSGQTGSATPTGNISYSLDGGAAQTSTLAAGAATLNFGVLAAGGHSIAVNYAGDSLHAAAPPQTLALTVTSATCSSSVPATSFMNITYYTLGETDADAERLSSGLSTNYVLPALGTNGLPVFNTAATAGSAAVTAPKDLLADNEITWWSPQLNNGGAGGTSDVVMTGTGVVSLPFSNNAFFPPNGAGTNDSNGFQTAVLTGTLFAPQSETVSFSISSDDMAFLYLDGQIACDDGALHPAAAVPCTTSTIAAGTHTLQVFYADLYRTQAALDFSVTTSNVGTGAGQLAFGTMSFSPAATEPFGASQAITISDPVTYTGPLPTGAVSFVLNGVTYPATCSTAGQLGGHENCSAVVPAATIAALPVAVYPVTGSFAGDCNYAAAAAQSAPFTIIKASQTITFNNPGNKTYGGASFAVSASATSGLPVTVKVVSGPATISGNAVTITGAGTVVLEADQAGNADYNAAAPVQQSFTAASAALTVVVNNATKVYGSANPAFTSTVKGLIGADTVTVNYTTTATTSSPEGTYPINATVSGPSAANYAVTVTPGTLTITKTVLTVTVNNASRVYGAANPTFTGTITGLLGTDTATATYSTTATATSPVGSGYAISATVTGSDLGNYTLNIVPGTLTITPAALTITVANASKIYGTANPAFTSTLTGVKNGDTVPLTYSTTATTTSGVGSYPIAASTTDANYTATIVPGTLTIKPATLTIAVNSFTRVYGAVNPTFTGTVNGLLFSDAVTATYTTAALPSSPVGTYPITASISGGAYANYVASVTPGTLTITKAVLTATAVSQARAYDVANPALTYVVTGFVNGDTSSVVSGTATLTTTATLTSPVGTYPITFVTEGLTATNYSFAYAEGTLTVGNDSQAITFGPLGNQTYGAAPFALTATASSGLPVGYTVTGPATLSGSTLTITGAGLVTVTASQAGNANFTAANPVSQSFTVAKAVLTATADNQSRAYDVANPALTYTVTGFVNGDNSGLVSGTATLTTTAALTSVPGGYPITFATEALTATNYTFTYVGGTLTVGKGSQTITFGPLPNQIYGAAPITLTATASSGLPVSYTVTGPATISGATLTMTGVGLVTVTASQAGNADFTAATPVSQSFTVAKAVLTATAVNQARAYGAANPALTYTVAGFVNSDNSAVVSGIAALTTTATLTSAPGGYPITFSSEGLTAANYSFIYVAGTLTVTAPSSVATPSFNPGGGTFATAQPVQLSDASTGAVIHYTLDGSMPTANSPIYTAAIQVSASETINAIAVLSGVSSAEASATYIISAGSCQTVNYSKGFTTAAGLSLNGGATVSGSALQLTDGNRFEARSAFYTSSLPVSSYTTDFTLQMLNPAADGLTFVIQSNNAKALGQDGGGLGYAGIKNSMAFKLDLHNNNGEGVDSTGMYVDGAYPSTPAIDLTPARINLHSGHVFAVHIVYANAVTTGTITDTVTGVSATGSFPGDITKVVGDNAYVGFTGATGNTAANESILTWSYSGGTGCGAK